MTIRHIALLSFKPSVSKKDIEKIMLAMAELQQIIPQIASYAWGENNSDESLDRGFLHGFVMEFKTVADRKVYLEHPAHISVVTELLLPALVDGINSLLVFDYDY